MPSTICIDEEYRIPSLYACEKCEKTFPIKKGKILFILTVLFQYHKPETGSVLNSAVF